VCLAFCDFDDPDSCAEKGLPGSSCIAYNQGALPLCEDECDPLAQDCPEPEGCYPAGDQGFVCMLPGLEQGMGEDGDECWAVQACAPGLLCVVPDLKSECAGLEACCTPFCDLEEGGAECTKEGETCLPYYEQGMVPLEYEDVGFCGVP
jgi:hypothetical protein